MTNPKTLEQLRTEKERAETQLAQEQHKLERLENRKKYLEKGERTKRTRPCFSAEHLLHQPQSRGLFAERQGQQPKGDERDFQLSPGKRHLHP
mgnify:FL=1